MALKGLTVMEFAGLAPAPFCGMILADFGARVIRIDRVTPQSSRDTLGRGKESITVDLKKPGGIEVIRRLSRTSDVLIEPFRKGVMEKLGLGPEKLMTINPQLIYARLTGFGQNGPYAARAGHDINFLAMSGILSTLGRANERPHPPINLLGDFAGGSLMCCLGILASLQHRSQTGTGQLVDAGMTAGAAYLGSWLWKSRNLPLLWDNERGKNPLDGGIAGYDTYQTSDGKYMAVGALEPAFYSNLLRVLELDEEEFSMTEDQEKVRMAFREKFLSQSQEYWSERFAGVDACCTPVLSLDEAAAHPHNAANDTFMKNQTGGYEPAPAPLLSKSPATSVVREDPDIGQHTEKVLEELNFTAEEIDSLISTKSVMQKNISSKI
ncbi:alpha-methylacyl-CoA racemase-like [Argonauta hians]